MSSDLLCLVISLERAEERRRVISKALEAEGISFEILQAVDGAAADFKPEEHPDIDVERATQEMGRPMLNGEFACALSHVQAYRRFLASSASHLLVLEDDAEIRPDLRRFIDERCYERRAMFLLHHRMAWVRPQKSDRLYGNTRAIALANTPTMCAGYTLDRETAKRLLDHALPIRRVADWPMDIPDLGACAVVPMPVGHPPFSEAGEQSMIGSYRPYDNKRPFHPFLSPGFFRRKWRQVGARKVS